MHPLQIPLYELLKTIPHGKVTTYKALAEALGNKNLCRAVGKWLNKNTDPNGIPCFKVVHSDGRLGGYAFGIDEKIRRLKEEGIEVGEDKKNIIYFLYLPLKINLQQIGLTHHILIQKFYVQC